MLPGESLTFRVRAGKRVFEKHLAVAVKQIECFPDPWRSLRVEG